MSVTTFDTLKAVKALTGAGMEAAHAEAIADTMREAVSEGVATKADLANLETRLTIRLYGAAAAIVAAVVALVKLL